MVRCGAKGILIHCWQICKLAQPLWRAISHSLVKWKVHMYYNSAITFPQEMATCAQGDVQECLW